ncbi:MAG: hypothetical protein H7Y20_05730 [Bryobacteraceae bacterium]|nr:hypothetical protein [Bryobacteraceae bacterium]
MRLPAKRWIRAQDIAWLLLFLALAIAGKSKLPEIGILLCLGLLQTIEPRVPFFATDRGRIFPVVTKLGLTYLLIGWTGGISSTYYVILLLPVVAAATTLDLPAVFGTTILACFSYLSFLLYVDWSRYELTPEAVGEVGLRVVFLPVVALLTQQLAQENRVAARRYQTAASELEAANRNVQAAEATLRRTERLAALGQLTAGLAHELRNPLGTMRASAEMLTRSVPQDNAIAREMAGFISAEVDRTNSLITRFLEFARPVRLHIERTDLTAVIDAAILELERHQPPLRVTIYRNYVPDLPHTPADGELLQRVFYNLLLNAAQATPPGGTVTVKTRSNGDHVEVSVIDRGGGIEETHREHIFNPFFTTRPEGTGLGLAIVSRIVDDHGGKINVESEQGTGSIFRVLLSLNDKSDTAEQTSGSALR